MAARPTWTDAEVRTLVHAHETVQCLYASLEQERRGRRFSELAESAQFAKVLARMFRAADGAFCRASRRLPGAKLRRRRAELMQLAELVAAIGAERDRMWLYSRFAGGQEEELPTAAPASDERSAGEPASEAPSSDVIPLDASRRRGYRARTDRPHVTIDGV